MKDKEKLTETEVIDVMKFANELYNNGNFFGVFTPQLLNQNLIDLNNNPAVPTKQNLDKALKDYKYSADLLQSYSEFAEVFDGLYNRTLNHYADLLAFDLHITCKNAYRDSDYKSEEYKNDKKRVYKFFDNFEYKGEFKKALKNMIRNEIFYTWLRDSRGTFDKTGEIELDENGNQKIKKMSKYTLQIMPQDRCILTGYWEKGLLFDIDMYHFLKAGVDINAYDPIFKKYFKEVLGENNYPHYNPSAQLGSRDGSFSLWTQTSPEDGAWCFKFDMSNLSTTPFLSSLIKQVLTNDEVARLQTDSNMLSARAILAGAIPLMEKQQSGQNTDAMSWKPDTLMKFLTLVKKGLTANINAVAMPTENNDFYQFDNKNPDMLEKQLNISGGNGASAGRLIYSSGKISEFELKSQIITDYNFVRKTYSQFENFLNYYVNMKTRKYKFEFHLDGCTHPFVREAEKKNLMDLADRGVILNTSAYSKIVDMTPQEFDRSLQESKYSKWTEELLSQFLSIHTQSGKEEKGAPVKDDNEISENGAVARDY